MLKRHGGLSRNEVILLLKRFRSKCGYPDVEKICIVPESDYSGLPVSRKFHNSEDMITEMKAYLQSLKAGSAWNEETAVTTIKSIMNHYMGEPPAEIMVDGEKDKPSAISS